MRRTAALLAFAGAMALGLRAEAQQESWDKDLGKPAPRLIAAGWAGTPVSLDALRRSDANSAADPGDGATVARKSEISGGNTVVLAFWTADIPC